MHFFLFLQCLFASERRRQELVLNEVNRYLGLRYLAREKTFRVYAPEPNTRSLPVEPVVRPFQRRVSIVEKYPRKGAEILGTKEADLFSVNTSLLLTCPDAAFASFRPEQWEDPEI